MSFETITAKEYRELPKKKPSKYHNKKVEYDGYKFDSIKEKDRYLRLMFYQQLGFISYLEVHPKYLIIPKTEKNRAQYYTADFEYHNKTGWVVEDVKSVITRKNRVYINNKKAMKYIYNIDVKEV